MRFCLALTSLVFALSACTSTTPTPVATWSPAPVISVKPAAEARHDTPWNKIIADEDWEHFKRCPQNLAVARTKDLVICPTHLFVAELKNGKVTITSPVEGAQAMLGQKDGKSFINWSVANKRVYTPLFSVNGQKFNLYHADVIRAGLDLTKTYQLVLIITDTNVKESIALPAAIQEDVKATGNWPFYL